MKKNNIRRIIMAAAVVSILPLQGVEACSSFIIGKNLTTDGSVLYGRTEDYPFLPQPGAHNKNYIVTEAKDYKEGDKIEDKSNGFTYPHLKHEFKYTSVPDASRDTDEGVYGAHGQNEHGVTMTATTSAVPHEKILEVDPLVKDGLAESSFVDTILPRVKTAREGIELVAKIIDEKGSAEGNDIVIADQNELWYMEIYSGHQYVAIKYPDDKYSIYPNTYFLGNVDFNDKENVIASKDIESVPKKADHYQEVDGKFHLAKSYGPDYYTARNRSRAYAGIKLMDPNSKINYLDDHFDFFQTPTDSNRRYSVEDAIAVQRNRFETLKEGFIPDDQYDKRGKDGKPEVNSALDGDKYKFAPGNENVIDAHIYQIKKDLPAPMASIMWLSQAPSRNTPYIPFYGNVNDTYKAFKPQDATYNKDSFYWVAWHIDQMAIHNQDIFGTSTKEKWQELEKKEIAEQEARNAKYIGKTADDAAKASSEVTKDSLERSEKLFKELQKVEKEMMQTIKDKGGKDDSIKTLEKKFKEQKEDTAKTENAANGVEATVSNKESKTKNNQTGLFVVVGLAVVAVVAYLFFKKSGKNRE
ncbi:C69 family dipeptidase [Streptococcus massiliensis]|uniref:Dipeptidase n=1 Tax=Streptococcus massiliensis TaxID=313439 RepID=A0A380L1Z0_9STRE|nr:C69 family dipeptidase [Streptococcus massiliensis]SUN77385.1 abpB family dipeptidase lipoprotein [Streptococcus massiliensis]